MADEVAAAHTEQPAAPATETAGPPEKSGKLRKLGALFLTLLGLVAAYYVGGALWINKIDDDPTFGQSLDVPAGASRTVAVAAALIDREVNNNRWTANDPWFQPSAILDNMPSFQTGIIASVSRFTVELTDHVARVRGSSPVDADIEAAAGRLKYPGDVWFLEWSSRPVQPSTESQYREALTRLRAYNERLARGQASFERRADTLMVVLERMAADMGGSSAAALDQINDRSWFDFTDDNLFYNIKGRLYGNLLLLEAMGQDFAQVIRERQLEQAWAEMLTSLRIAAQMDPWLVMNGPLDSVMRPNHLASQGFLLMRGRFLLYAVRDILMK